MEIRALTLNKEIDFEPVILNENDIISFAKAFDPLDFHTNIEIAKASHFKGLIASGPQLFNENYRRFWVPMFGKTVICGLEIKHWKYLQPVYANQFTIGKVTVKEFRKNEEKKHATINWFFEFFDEKGLILQQMEMIVLHNI